MTLLWSLIRGVGFINGLGMSSRNRAPLNFTMKKKQPKKFGVSEPVKSPTEPGASGLQTPAGRQIVSPEECSCDCHHTSPPQTLSRQKTPAVPVLGSVSRRKVTPPAGEKTEPVSRGAVPKSGSKRVVGPPTPPIRTTSVQKGARTR